MKTILALNPGEKKGAKKMKKNKSKNTPKKNPSSKGIGRRARGLLTNLRPQKAVVGALEQTGGMLLTQFFAKKFVAGGGANDPNWGYKNYLMGTVGAFAAGITAEMMRKGKGHEFLKGGLSLIAYKIFVNEIAPQNEFLQANFGADEEEGDYLEISPEYGAEEMDINMLLGEDDDEFIMDEDGVYDELGDDDDDDEIDVLLGDELAPVGPLGADPFARVFGGNDDIDTAMWDASQA